MRFKSKKPKENIANLARILGYRLLKGTNDEFNLVRPLGRDYPRFHVYLKEDNGFLDFNLHLDQKRPSYSKQTMHSGEYDGELILGEQQRIQKILSSLL
ncbi:hypothetical protein L6250_02570 [Candidatus Parcubacteria bacterium]|nr:hypothetical protein [Patescibacteria group bacterium]MCG2688494.1 hypothetical protein [Candidatus Parcubacteria bacterium]